MKGKITSVSLGPGDPELITCKALRILQEADIIFCPGTSLPDGTLKSRAFSILEGLPVEEAKIHFFAVPMSRNRAAAFQAYEEAGKALNHFVEAGKQVALVAEGDACFYSSAHHLFSCLQTAGITVEMVPGVPAFIAAGASAGLHLVKQQERLLVIPGEVHPEELEEALEREYTIVIMKVPLGEIPIRSFMKAHPACQYHYFEQVGGAGEFYTSQYAEIVNRTFTYFSILVILPR